MVRSVENGGEAVEILLDHFDPTAVVPEPLPKVVETDGELVNGKSNGDREIVLGRNVHTTCLEVTEPEANDDFTGDKDAFMASILARYRKTLLERTKHHLGNFVNKNMEFLVFYYRKLSLLISKI